MGSCAERICQPGPSIKSRCLCWALRNLWLASAWAEPGFCSTKGHNQHPAWGSSNAPCLHEHIGVCSSVSLIRDSCSMRSSMQTISPDVSWLFSIPADVCLHEGPNIRVVQGASSCCTRRHCSGTTRKSSCLGILALTWVCCLFGVFFPFHPFLFHFLPAPQEAMAIDTPCHRAHSLRYLHPCSLGFHFSVGFHWNAHLISVLILPVAPKHLLRAQLSQKGVCRPCHHTSPSPTHASSSCHSPLLISQAISRGEPQQSCTPRNRLLCHAALTHSSLRARMGRDGTGQHQGGGREVEEETTIAQARNRTWHCWCSALCYNIQPVTSHRFIHGLFSLSPTWPRHPEQGPTTRWPRSHRLCPGSYRLLCGFPSDAPPSPPLSPRHLYSCFLPSSWGLRCKANTFLSIFWR